MNNTIKILALGISQSNFLNQLYGDLRKKYDHYSFAIDNFFDISRGQLKNDDSLYSNSYFFEKEKISRFESIKTFLNFSREKLFWEVFYFELSKGKTYKETYYFLRSMAYNKAIVERYILPLDFDVFHFHYCNPQNLRYLHFIPKGRKVVCSFWGSDLMRETGIDNVFYVTKALQNADVITVQNHELAEMLYCKYGREQAKKTKIIQFTIHTEIYDKIDELRNNQEKINDFKLKYHLPVNKTIIAVSHNAFRGNQLLEILTELEKLSKPVKDRISVLLHLGYGREKKYLDELSQFISESDLNIVEIHSYFGPEEMALLRLSTDIMIQMPISDALSGAMTEILYAGKQVYAGAWLPYGILRRNGVSFFEIDEHKKIPQSIEDYFSRRESLINQNKFNPDKIKNFLFPDKTTADWNQLFHHLSIK
ncbi:MAG TPA: hypothetical protein DCQ50_12920 [Chryseobacterium sp.]|nr:hypothetical protein [Chryseobacterium sp.]